MFKLSRSAFATLISLTVIGSAPAKAASLFGDLSAAGGYSKSAISGEGTSPTMGTYTGGLCVGLKVARFKLGARTAYSQIVQYSEVTETGNRRGSRWAKISPVLGINLGRIEIRGDYQFLGDYMLANADENGTQVSYTRPSGFGAELLFSISHRVALGTRYERVSFSNENVGGVETSLAEKLALSSIGALIHVKL